MTNPNRIPDIDLNDGLDEVPSGGLMIEEADGTKRPATDADLELLKHPQWYRDHVRKFQAQRLAEIAEDDARRNTDKIARRRADGLPDEPRQYVKHGFKPGYRHEQLTLVDRDWQSGLHGNKFCNGWWLATCECGATVRVKTQWLRLKFRCARACAECLSKMPELTSRPNRQPRAENAKPLGRPHKQLEGKVFGRLTVRMWCNGLGWLCGCEECGGQEVCRNSAYVMRRGSIGCDGTCVHE